ncbi:MAG: phosphoribosyltransferase, partial [Acidobacteriota bacterium]
RALGAPLDLLIVRKLGVPGEEELAFGAMTRGGVRVLNDEIVAACRLTSEDIERVVAREELELERRAALYRGGRPVPDPHGKVIILVDDGLATGATMRAAVAALLTEDPLQIVVAVPVAAGETCREFDQIDPRVTIICLLTPSDFQAVGLWYDDFSQVTDDEVIRLLAQPPEPSSRP